MLSTIFIPMLYTPVKWYHVLVAYVVSPFFALPVSLECLSAPGWFPLTTPVGTKTRYSLVLLQK